MGLRFRKSIKILPGLRVNLGKNGISSVSVGGKGLTVNHSKKGTRVTAGVRGTGLSYSEYISNKPTPRNQTTPQVPHQPIHTPAQPPRTAPVKQLTFLHGVIVGVVVAFILLIMLK